MEKVIFHVNLNYELFLSGSNKSVKGSSWFDHIFFFINRNPNATLKSNYSFSKDYLTFIEKIGVASNKVTTQGISSPWWGSCNDIDRERFFNSKISMTKLGLDKGWIPVPSTTTKESAKVELHYPMIAREEWGFSGRGVKVIRDENDLSKVVKTSVFSDFVEKEKDYGITFNLKEGSFFIIENFIDSYGQFKGGIVREASDSIGDKNLRTLLTIRDELVSLGAEDSIEIDTFTYKEGFHPFVEVNYRKTMGLFVKSLEYYFDSEKIYWVLISYNGNSSFKEICEQLKDYKEKVALLSPVGKFLSIAILTDKEINTAEAIDDLEKFLR